MPGIRLFKRRWAIGSDDFVFPSFIELCLRFAWLLTISVLFGLHRGSFECPNGYLLHNYYVGAIVLLSVSILHTLVTMVVSMRGTIRDARPRRHLNVLIYSKFAILLPEAAWVILASYWAFGYSFSCDWPVYWAARGAVICAWIVGFWIFVSILLVFDPLGSAESRVQIGDTMTKKGSEYLIDSTKSKNARVWETRCRCLCCCISHSQDNDEAFSDVSKLVADFFQDTDLVPTDIAAGLMLVERYQKGIDADLSNVVIVSAPSGQSQLALPAGDIQRSSGGEIEGGEAIMNGSLRTPVSWMTVPVMAHYMKFALGSYGWPFFMYSNLFTGLCRLCASCSYSAHEMAPAFIQPCTRHLVEQFAYLGGGRDNVKPPSFQENRTKLDGIISYLPSCCACIRQPNRVFSDNGCQCHTAAIKQLTKVQTQDLVYVSFHNKYREIPFYVAVDRKFNNVVVSIRGTLSLQDALTDLSAQGVPLHIEGVPDATCHDAMYDCAKFIKAQLEEKNLLEQAFSTLQEGSQLVIVGHSLGAGVAAILAVLLRPQHPGLACFAYSPPGGLLSASASRYAQDFVCSVIVGEDIIPRLGMPTMCDLKVKLLRALCECNTPKYKILATGCFRILCSCLASKEGEVVEEVSRLTDGRHNRYSTVHLPITPEEDDDYLKNALKSAEDYAREMLQREWPTHPPGQILHIVEEEESKVCGEGPQYTAVWARPEDFSSILISHKMVLDHFPDVVMRALDQLSERNFVPRAFRVGGDSSRRSSC